MPQEELHNKRTELAQQIRESLLRPKSGVTLIDAELGLGKTHAIARLIKNDEIKSDLIIGFQTKRLAFEFIEKIGNVGYFVEGR